MLTVEDYGVIRRAHRDGMSVRAIARTFHHSRRTIRQVLRQPEPAPYTRTREPPAPVLGEFMRVIDQILADDEYAPPKQRHTAAQIHRRLRDEYAYSGSYSPVRRYVAKHRRCRRETFIPLAHDPGQRMEMDFGHIQVDLPQGRRLVPVFTTTWGYSHAPFVMAMPTERIEAVLAGAVAAFEFFRCVPREVWWDNPKTVVKAVRRGRDREIADRWQALASHYLFEPLFCMPGKGNEKPRVENRVYDLQRRWATPVPHAKDLHELNEQLRDKCVAEQQRTVASQTESIGRRLEQDRQAALPLPQHAFDACIYTSAKVDKYQTLSYDGNHYSVPRHCAFQTVAVKAYTDHIEVVAGHQTVARHRRSYEKKNQILDPLHYLVTLGARPAALDHSSVYRGWPLPECFAHLRAQLEQRHGAGAGAREYIRVLQLLPEHSLTRLTKTVEECLARGVLDPEWIRHRVHPLGPIQGRNPASPDNHSCSGGRHVPMPDLTQFNQLLMSGDHNHVRRQHAPALEVEPQAASTAHDLGRVRQVGL